MLNNYMIMDVETTGLSNQDKIIEIGIVKVDSGIITDYYWSLLNPEKHVTVKIEQITGLNDEILRNKPTFDIVYKDILQFISNHTIIGYNIQFDIRMLNLELARLNLSTIKNRYFDLYELTKLKFSNKLPNLQLGTICAYYSISSKNAHRAIKDCCLVKNLHDKMYLEFGESLYGTWR